MSNKLGRGLKRRVSDGRPNPLGATVVEAGVNFAIYSENAERVMLCLFDLEGAGEHIVALPARTGHIWHGHVYGLGVGQRYGFRIEGPYRPEQGQWFNSAKLLQDPYARAMSGEVRWDDSVFGYRRAPAFDLSIRNLADSAASVPRSIVTDNLFDWAGVRQPRHAMADTIIYECHAKGLTQLFEAIPEDLRGSYAGMAQPPVVEHLAGLGITAIELLPVHAFISDEFLVERELTQYWGYNTLGFFAPEGQYSATGDGGEQITEFKTMVRTMHAAGIEVLLDVVYNHSAEGSPLGPTLSFRGIDNSVYYRLSADKPEAYEDYSGTGNTLNTSHPAVVRLVLDSLRYWVTEMQVDGFRFDLATCLGRDFSGFDPYSKLMTAIAQDPVLQQVKLIAEPWDIGPGGYQVGHFAPGWSEWNDRFRDATRSFWLGHQCTIGEFALRLTGSSDLYDRSGRGPLASVNFADCHDGFNLVDLVSYDHKHNLANGEENRDGSNNNLSRNFGVEGKTDNSAVLDKRDRARRNLLATTLLSHGIPLLAGGDELSHTQQGNNNPYCQDNEITWLGWRSDERSDQFLDFCRRLLWIRKNYPALRPIRFIDSECPTPHEPDNISWHDSDGSELNQSTWSRQQPRILQLTIKNGNHGRPGDHASILLLFNADERAHDFRIPALRGVRISAWQVALDTSSSNGSSQIQFVPGADVAIAGSSIVVASARR